VPGALASIGRPTGRTTVEREAQLPKANGEAKIAAEVENLSASKSIAWVLEPSGRAFASRFRSRRPARSSSLSPIGSTPPRTPPISTRISSSKGPTPPATRLSSSTESSAGSATSEDCAETAVSRQVVSGPGLVTAAVGEAVNARGLPMAAEAGRRAGDRRRDRIGIMSARRPTLASEATGMILSVLEHQPEQALVRSSGCWLRVSVGGPASKVTSSSMNATLADRATLLEDFSWAMLLARLMAIMQRVSLHAQGPSLRPGAPAPIESRPSRSGGDGSVKPLDAFLHSGRSCESRYLAPHIPIAAASPTT
jgi:hypothetical protein